MNVRTTCQRGAITVRRFDELVTAARLMREKHVSLLVVLDGEGPTEASRPIGVVSDRDIVLRAVARGADPCTLKVDNVMNYQPVVIEKSDTIEHALLTMERIGARHVPVVGKKGEIFGVLSIDDVLKVLARDMQRIARSIRRKQDIESVLHPCGTSGHHEPHRMPPLGPAPSDMA